MNEEAQAQIEKLQIRNRELTEALELAIMAIESYQLDIRSSENHKWLGVDLIEKGFCQGSFYLRAVPLIKQKAGLPLKPWDIKALEGED